jgi:hypothetical protein
MPILGTDAYRFTLASELRSVRTAVSLVSAFITVPGIHWVLKHLSPTAQALRVVTRWSCWDLVVGASDLEVYTILESRCASLYILPDLHAKIVLIDDRTLFLGSANLTNSGLRLVPGGNREIGIRITPNQEDLQVIEALFDEATLVTPDLFNEIQSHVLKLRKTLRSQERPRWPDQLMSRLKRISGRLWVAELLWTESPSKLWRHDLSAKERKDQFHDLTLLGVEPQTLDADMREAFIKSRASNWLLARLSETDSHELYFGELTSLLHDALLDDPKPYRQDVKKLALNLITWAEEILQPRVSTDRPKHSQRIRLNLD